MHYVALVNGEEKEVEINEVAPDRYQIYIDGRHFDVDARAVSDTTLSMIVNNEAFNIESERDPNGGDNLLLRGHVFHVEVLDLRRMRLRKAQQAVGGPDGPVEITAPMPGKIVAVHVRDGQEVQEGQGLVVVEAMKMENELRAPKAGVVRNLRAQEGSAVDGGTVLCVVE